MKSILEPEREGEIRDCSGFDEATVQPHRLAKPLRCDPLAVGILPLLPLPFRRNTCLRDRSIPLAFHIK